jgi:metal-sulfur cluster biosynthetic enzyme
MINKQLIWNNLSEVMDPELDVDIVSLGLIYEVIVKGEIVKIVMTLTTPGCPLAGVIDRMVKEAAASVEGVEEENVETELVWDPPWIQAMMSEEARLRLGFL